MTSRVYALWGRSKCVALFLWTCFGATQCATVVMIAIGCRGVQIQEPIALPLPGCGSCEWYIPDNAQKLIAVSNFVSCGYELILVVMALYCFAKHVREGHQSSQLTLKTFFGVVVRDNVIYFLIELCALALSAVSYLYESVYDTPGWLTFEMLEIIFTTFSTSLLGPLMMLSIRRYDVAQVKGGTINSYAMDSMHFAAAPRPLGTYQDDIDMF